MRIGPVRRSWAAACRLSVLAPFAQSLVGPAQPVPEPEIQAEVAAIVAVMAVMVACRDQPCADPSANYRSGEDFPSQVIGDPEQRHHSKNAQQRRYMDRDDEHQQRNDDGPGHALPRMDAPRRPCGGRTAGEMTIR